MTIKIQKKINIINDCKAIVDTEELEKAILWYTDNPTQSKKHIYIYGKYPAVSILKEKIHIHRLLMMYWTKSKIPNNCFIHHIDENKLNASKNNLKVIPISVHQSFHNKGKINSILQREATIRSNHNRKGKNVKKHRQDVGITDVLFLQSKGYSINKIAILLKCDWSTIKSRIYENPELLEATNNV